MLTSDSHMQVCQTKFWQVLKCSRGRAWSHRAVQAASREEMTHCICVSALHFYDSKRIQRQRRLPPNKVLSLLYSHQALCLPVKGFTFTHSAVTSASEMSSGKKEILWQATQQPAITDAKSLWESYNHVNIWLPTVQDIQRSWICQRLCVCQRNREIKTALEL